MLQRPGATSQRAVRRARCAMTTEKRGGPPPTHPRAGGCASRQQRRQSGGRRTRRLCLSPCRPVRSTVGRRSSRGDRIPGSASRPLGRAALSVSICTKRRPVQRPAHRHRIALDQPGQRRRRARTAPAAPLSSSSARTAVSRRNSDQRQFATGRKRRSGLGGALRRTSEHGGREKADLIPQQQVACAAVGPAGVESPAACCDEFSIWAPAALSQRSRRFALSRSRRVDLATPKGRRHFVVLNAWCGEH